MYDPFVFKRGTYRAAMPAGLAFILNDLFLDIATLLEDDLPDLSDPLVAMTGISSEATAPTNPALRRLLPDGAREADELAAEYRRFTDIPLRQNKAANLRRAAATLMPEGEHAGDDPVKLRLDEEECQAWLTATADARLVLAEQLGIASAADAEKFEEWLAREDHDEADTPRMQAGVLYEILADLQTSLVHAATRAL